ncbi:MAG: phenylalanine--tRNA ligase subunit beta [Bacteroidetes bacterium]|nr:phenylalanine--tRNA ligase subunit beta [Bacteroidota bacterium]
MKISYNWLKLYHNLDVSPDKVAEILTGCGLEVESVETFESVKGGLKGVVIGEVLTCEKHPNSDHLSLTTVNVGANDPLKIVCGASNVAAGQKVAVAVIGTTLYFAEKEITLQRTKIRGEVSEGMICAEDELGLGSSHAGIMVLPQSAKVGMSAKEYFGVEEDVVFTIGLTPNRVDAASHIGVARDLIAVMNNYGKTGTDRLPDNRLLTPDLSGFTVDNNNRRVSIVIDDSKACPRYSGISISGIKVKDSPEWLKNRLLAIGLRPINNIVDITNFVLMETGQPLHAFDLSRIEGNQVIVRKYAEGTPFTTLDGVERRLSENDLMICNAVEPMCIGGVFGGLKSGVSSETTGIFLESACFDPVHIRRTSKLHGVQTDASFRFERGSDIAITINALKRAAMMIKEIAGGEISSEIVDVYPNPIPLQTVNFSYKNLDRLIGKTISRNVIKNILTDLGINILKETALNFPNLKPETIFPEPETSLLLEIPAFKVDVTRQADVIEEVLRIYGYNNIEINDEIKSSISYTSNPDPEKVQNLISDYLVSNGFFEMLNNSLTRCDYYHENTDFPEESCVKILNPISRDHDVMRQTLLYGALESVAYNINRKTSDLKLFEFGRIYSKSSNPGDLLPGYHEETHLALVLTGSTNSENWNTAANQVDFFEMKGYLHAIFKRLSLLIDKWVVESYSSGLISVGLRYSVNGKTVLIIGLVANQALKPFDIKQSVFYSEMNWDLLLSLISEKNISFTGIPRFPEVRRDLALLVDHQVTFSEIEKLAYQTEKKLLKNVGLFDVYEGGKIAAGKKSYAISFILRDEEKTLTDKEIDKTMDRLIKAMSANFNAQLR